MPNFSFLRPFVSSALKDQYEISGLQRITRTLEYLEFVAFGIEVNDIGYRSGFSNITIQADAWNYRATQSPYSRERSPIRFDEACEPAAVNGSGRAEPGFCNIALRMCIRWSTLSG